VVRALLLLVLAGISSPHVSARIATGEHPCGIAAGFGAVWIANDGSGSLARVNPRTNRVTRRIPVGRGACSVAIGSGFVWVTNYRTGSVVRVEPRTFRIRKVRVGSEPFDVLGAAGRIWVTAWGEGELVELGPLSTRVLRRVDVGPYPAGLAARAGSIWVGFGRAATAIAQIDPSSGRVRSVPVRAKSPAWFAVGSRDLWISADDNALVHVNPRSGTVLATVRLGRTLGHPAAARDGTIWVPDKEIDRVFRVDTVSGRRVDSFAGGDGAFEALSAFGSMWITSYAGADVWRYRLAKRVQFRHVLDTAPGELSG
jgi:DNA-binding beta-propeller fold protein YncE